MVIASPVDDALLDGFGLEILSEGFAEERGELVVGGESKSDELFDGELVDVGAIFGGQECGEAQAFFEADDSVLYGETALSRDASHHEEDDRHDDPPEVGVLVVGPFVNGDVDAEDEVEQKYGQNKEMKGRKKAGVIFEILRSGHGSPLWMRCDDGPQHTIWGRLERWRR